MENTETTNEDVEYLSEDTYKIPIRKERSRERGPDRHPRKPNLAALHNLRQYQNIPKEEFCMLHDNNDYNINKIFVIVFAVLALVVIGNCLT